MQDSIRILGVIGVAIVVALILTRKRMGALNAASVLVILGILVIVTEHPQFAITRALPAVGDPHVHARVHLVMSVVYALIGLILLGVIALTLLRDARKAEWYALLFALIAGGSSDLVFGGLWFQHGSPIFQIFGVESTGYGYGWEVLYLYMIAWVAALAISYRPIFARGSDPE